MSKYMVAALAFAILMLPVGGAPQSPNPTLWLNRDERRKALRTAFAGDLASIAMPLAINGLSDVLFLRSEL